MKNTDHNSNEKQMLLNEVKVKVQKLKALGVSEKDIFSYLHSEQCLQKLTVSKNYRIYLGENHVEVHMEPLVKAVFLLFLNHPEGIIFKNLSDYRQELTKIYSLLRPYKLTERALKSIENVTDPLLNSINEKCARIRRTFESLIDSNVAEKYGSSDISSDAAVM